MTHPQKQVHSMHLKLIPLPIPPPAVCKDGEALFAWPLLIDLGKIFSPPSTTLTEFKPTLLFQVNRRCAIKGCVFAVSEPGREICWIHALQEREPAMFQTRQPTQRVLEMAKYGITTEDEDTHVRQILRARATRRAFLKGVA